MSAITTQHVRRVLKAAGLETAKKFTSNNIKGGWTDVIRSGYTLKHETEYRRKQHMRTGNVEVDFLLRAHGGDADRIKLNEQRETARQALAAAGFTVTPDDRSYRLIVSAPSTTQEH